MGKVVGDKDIEAVVQDLHGPDNINAARSMRLDKKFKIGRLLFVVRIVMLFSIALQLSPFLMQSGQAKKAIVFIATWVALPAGHYQIMPITTINSEIT